MAGGTDGDAVGAGVSDVADGDGTTVGEGGSEDVAVGLAVGVEVAGSSLLALDVALGDGAVCPAQPAKSTATSTAVEPLIAFIP